MTEALPTQPPAPACVQEIADGVLWLRMPLPFALDHVNLYVLRDGESWTLVDTGMGDAVTRDLWDRLFAGPLAGRPVTRLVCTHFHPDHMGLAGWLCERFGIPLSMTFGEWVTGRKNWLDDGADYRDCDVAHYRRAGHPPEFLAQVAETGNAYRPRIGAPPAAFQRLEDGQVLTIGGRAWEVLTCGGHSPEHACLHCPEAGILIAGDQILPRISPIVGVWAQEPEARPLARFLAALDRLAGLPADTLVLPAHHLPFRSLRERCAELAAHHAERLEKTREACRDPVTAVEVLRILFRRPLDAHQMQFATGETLAHLNHLLSLGTVRRAADPRGVWLYQAC